MTNKLFNQETPEEPKVQPDQDEPQVAPQVDKEIDPSKPLFKVGDREYNAESAAKDIAHKQAFIEQLLKEKRELEQRVQEQESVDSKLQEALDKLNQQRIQDEPIPSQETKTVDQEQIMEQLRKIAAETSSETYQQKEQERLRQENLRKSIEAAKEAHGDSYEEVLREKGKALGLNEEQIQSIAQENPAMFAEMFARKVQAPPQAPTGRNGAHYAHRKQDLTLPRITGYWRQEDRVNKLREAEKMILQGLKDGTYKPKTF